MFKRSLCALEEAATDTERELELEIYTMLLDLSDLSGRPVCASRWWPVRKYQISKARKIVLMWACQASKKDRAAVVRKAGLTDDDHYIRRLVLQRILVLDPTLLFGVREEFALQKVSC